MSNYTQEITLDVDKNTEFKYIYAKQGDKGSRFVKATFIKNGEKLEVGKDEKAIFRARKPDGHSVMYEATVNEDKTITVELTEQTLAVEGVVDADIKIESPSGEVLSCANFKIEVEIAPLGNNIESSNEFLVLTKLIGDANNAISRAENTTNNILELKDSGAFNGDDYILTEQDKKDIAEIVKGLNGQKLTIYCPRNSEEGIAAMTEIMNKFSELSPLLIMPLYDDLESGMHYGNGILAVDSGTGSMSDAIAIPMCYSEVPLTSDLAESLNSWTNFKEDYSHYLGYLFLTGEEQDDRFVFNKAGDFGIESNLTYGGFISTTILMSLTVPAGYTSFDVIIGSMKKALTINLQEVIDEKGATVDLELTFVYELTPGKPNISKGRKMISKVKIYSASGMSYNSSVTDNIGSIAQISIPKDLVVNYACRKVG